MTQRINDITMEHLGTEATEAEVELFQAACWAYVRRTGATEVEAIDYIWGNGDYTTRMDSELRGELLALPRYTCLRCSHTWVPRTDKHPRWCPKCNSPYWDRERRVPKPQPQVG